MRRRYKRLLYGLLIVVTTLFVAVALLGTTQAGLEFTIYVAQKLVPGKLKITDAKGYLFGSIETTQIHYQSPTIEISLQKLNLQWQPLNLLRGRFHITHLELNRLILHTQPSPQPAQSKEGTSWQLPLNIQLDHVHISHFQYNTYIMDEIAIQRTYIGHNALQLQASLKQADKQFQIQAEGPWSGYQYQGTYRDKHTNLKYKGSGTQHSLALQTIEGRFMDGSIHARGHLQWRPKVIWSLQLRAKRWNVRAYWPGHSSQFGFNLKAAGAKQQWHVDLTQLDGKFDKQPIHGFAKLTLDQYRLTQADVHIDSKGAQLKIHGHQWPKWDLRWQAHIPQFHYFKKNWAGSLKSLGHIYGPANKPEIEGYLQTQSLLIHDYVIGHHRLKLQGHVSPQKHYRFQITSTGHTPELGLTFKPITIQVNGNPQSLVAQGIIHTGKNPLHLSLQSQLNQAQPTVKLSLNGTHVLISNTHHYRIFASPQFSMGYHDNQFTLSGDINIPEAKVELYNEAPITTLPDDVVFVEKKKKAPLKAGVPLQTLINLHLTLGDNVHFSAMGVQGMLRGGVQINHQPEQPETTARGEIRLKDAAYKAYGQNLEISTGRLIYQNSLLTNPSLDIRAAREIRVSAASINEMYHSVLTTPTAVTAQKITVGVHVKGTANEPEVALYSIPAGYRKSDILALLLTGAPLSQVQQAAQEGQMAMLLEAAQFANGGAPSQIGKVSSEIKHTLGLSELGITNQVTAVEAGAPTATNAALVIGKYITPRLYISYTQDLLDPVNMLQARYDLGKHWQIQTETSTVGSGLDLFYTIER